MLLQNVLRKRYIDYMISYNEENYVVLFQSWENLSRQKIDIQMERTTYT